MSDRDTEKKMMQMLELAEKSEQKDDVIRQLRGYLLDKVEGEIDYSGEEKIQPLTELYSRLMETHDFQVGQIVKWKSKLKNRRKPKYDEPAIIVEYIKEDPPLHSKDEATPYYREPLNLGLGLIDDDGELDVYYFDSRRFEPYKT